MAVLDLEIIQDFRRILPYDKVKRSKIRDEIHKIIKINIQKYLQIIDK